MLRCRVTRTFARISNNGGSCQIVGFFLHKIGWCPSPASTGFPPSQGLPISYRKEVNAATRNGMANGETAQEWRGLFSHPQTQFRRYPSLGGMASGTTGHTPPHGLSAVCDEELRKLFPGQERQRADHYVGFGLQVGSRRKNYGEYASLTGAVIRVIAPESFCRL